MFVQTLLTLVAGLLIAFPALAQLGPRDGATLAPTDLQRIQVGAPAPDFTLEDTAGERISLSNFRGEKNVILVFYRGHW